MRKPVLCNILCFCGHYFGQICNFCFDVAICDLVHDVETVHGICSLPTASRNHGRDTSDAHKLSENYLYF